MKKLQGHLTNNKQLRVDSNTTQVSASSPKGVQNSTVLSCCRKAASDCTSLMEDGSEFQAQAGETGNVRCHNVYTCHILCISFLTFHIAVTINRHSRSLKVT